MINIQTIATGSKGNCYIISDGSSRLLLEVGIPFQKIQEALYYDLENIDGALITHEHKDHCKGVESALKRAIPMYMSEGTKQALKLNHHLIKTVTSKVPFTIGNWTILPFDVQHDVAEPLGFLIANKSGDKLLFATDTYYIKYKFKGLTHLMIECNYDQQTLDDNLKNGLHPAQYKRVMKSHFSLENLLEFLKSSDITNVEEIHLLHLSDRNANERYIYEQVAMATGKIIVIH